MTPQKIKVRCPGCGITLEVTNSKNEAQKRFACPQCAKNLVVMFDCHEQDGETQLGGKPSTYETQVAQPGPQAKSCRLVLGAKDYDLEIGRNTVGRKARTSTADVQLDTDDHYISRVHAVINVRRLSNGALKTDISAHDNAKNPTRVNGAVLLTGDAIVLHSGDKIQMGDTTLTYRENE